jgi:hypothetical protein
MSAQLLSAVAGALLSLLCSYIPGLSDWYAALDGTHKRLWMLAALCAVAAGSLGLSCLGIGQAGGVALPACSSQGAQTLVEALVIALAANQSTYLISPKRPEA